MALAQQQQQQLQCTPQQMAHLILADSDICWRMPLPCALPAATTGMPVLTQTVQ